MPLLSSDDEKRLGNTTPLPFLNANPPFSAISLSSRAHTSIQAVSRRGISLHNLCLCLRPNKDVSLSAAATDFQTSMKEFTMIRCVFLKSGDLKSDKCNNIVTAVAFKFEKLIESCSVLCYVQGCSIKYYIKLRD